MYFIMFTLLQPRFYNLFPRQENHIAEYRYLGALKGALKTHAENQFLTLSLFMKFTVAALLSYVFLRSFSCT